MLRLTRKLKTLIRVCFLSIRPAGPQQINDNDIKYSKITTSSVDIFRSSPLCLLPGLEFARIFSSTPGIHGRLLFLQLFGPILNPFRALPFSWFSWTLVNFGDGVAIVHASCVSGGCLLTSCRLSKGSRRIRHSVVTSFATQLALGNACKAA